MQKFRTQLRNVQNVAAGKTALIDIPIGPRYHYVQLQLVDGTAATVAALKVLFDSIRVIVNGTVQRTYGAGSGTGGIELNDYNALNGAAYGGYLSGTKTANIPIFFAEPWRSFPADREALAWPTNRWNSLRMEVDIASGANAPALTAWAVWDGYQAQQAPGIVKIQRQSVAAAGTSYDVLLDRKDWLQQISIYKDSGGSVAVSKATLRKDGVVHQEFTLAANNAFLLQNGMTPLDTARTNSLSSSSVFDIVLDHDDLLGSSVPLQGASSASLTIEAGSAMSGSQVLQIARHGGVD